VWGLGDIVWVEIHPTETRGAEQFKQRPYVIVSRTGINRALKTIVGVPLSLGAVDSGSSGFRIFIPKEEIIGAQNPQDCIAKCDQVRSFDPSERVRGKFGRLSATALSAVGAGLGYLFDLR
jgi:mRNA-degrading endonuclease toxin of MazEF toxin-antitoxin module